MASLKLLQTQKSLANSITVLQNEPELDLEQAELKYSILDAYQNIFLNNNQEICKYTTLSAKDAEDYDEILKNVRFMDCSFLRFINETNPESEIKKINYMFNTVSNLNPLNAINAGEAEVFRILLKHLRICFKMKQEKLFMYLNEDDVANQLNLKDKFNRMIRDHLYKLDANVDILKNVIDVCE